MRSPSMDSDTELPPEVNCDPPSFANPPLNVISLQSTSRPGCIIELVPIADAIQVIVIENSRLYSVSYNTCRDRWHVTSNGEDKMMIRIMITMMIMI